MNRLNSMSRGGSAYAILIALMFSNCCCGWVPLCIAGEGIFATIVAILVVLAITAVAVAFGLLCVKNAGNRKEKIFFWVLIGLIVLFSLMTIAGAISLNYATSYDPNTYIIPNK